MKTLTALLLILVAAAAWAGDSLAAIKASNIKSWGWDKHEPTVEEAGQFGEMMAATVAKKVIGDVRTTKDYASFADRITGAYEGFEFVQELARQCPSDRALLTEMPARLEASIDDGTFGRLVGRAYDVKLTLSYKLTMAGGVVYGVAILLEAELKYRPGEEGMRRAEQLACAYLKKFGGMWHSAISDPILGLITEAAKAGY